MDKWHPGYFGKVGMRHFHLLRNRKYSKPLNLEKLWQLAGPEALEASKNGGGKAPVIDITAHGYTKLMGKGVLPDLPIIVKARYFSNLAERKIRAAGGAVLLTA